MNTKQREVQVSVPDYQKPKANVLEISQLASELFEIESKIKELETAHDEEMEPLKQIRDERRGVLLQMMQEARQKHVDVNDGQNFFVRANKATFEITDEEAAMKFAKKEGLIRIDKVQLNKTLLRLPKVPKGFEQVDSEHLKLQTSKE